MGGAHIDLRTGGGLMIELGFAVTGARVDRHAGQATLRMGLRVSTSDGRAIEGAALRCQLRLEPQRRAHTPEETVRLLPLFGPPDRWPRTVRPLPWTESSLLLPAFERSHDVELAIAGASELDAPARRYVQALGEGDVPVRLHFRGTVFARGGSGLHLLPLPWDREAEWRLPVSLWRDALDGQSHDVGWICLGQQTIDALGRFKLERALPSWDGVIAALLEGRP
jgi:hypothetical protein